MILKYMLTYLKYIPFLIDQLHQIADNCFILQNSVKKLNSYDPDHPYLDFKINALSNSDQNLLNQQTLQWADANKKFFVQGQKIVLLCTNVALNKQLH